MALGQIGGSARELLRADVRWAGELCDEIGIGHIGCEQLDGIAVGEEGRTFVEVGELTAKGIPLFGGCFQLRRVPFTCRECRIHRRIHRRRWLSRRVARGGNWHAYARGPADCARECCLQISQACGGHGVTHGAEL